MRTASATSSYASEGPQDETGRQRGEKDEEKCEDRRQEQLVLKRRVERDRSGRRRLRIARQSDLEQKNDEERGRSAAGQGAERRERQEEYGLDSIAPFEGASEHDASSKLLAIRADVRFLG